MASLMQKDVIIEVLASVRAQIYRYEDTYGTSDETKSILDELSNKRSWVYSTKPEDIDFPEFVKYKNKVKEKYPA